MQEAKRSNVTTLAILTVLTLLTWVFVETYQRLSKIEISNIPPGVLAPLEPTIDQEVLNILKNKEQFSDEQVNRFTPTVGNQNQITTATQATQTQESTASAQEE